MDGGEEKIPSNHFQVKMISYNNENQKKPEFLLQATISRQWINTFSLFFTQLNAYLKKSKICTGTL